MKLITKVQTPRVHVVECGRLAIAYSREVADMPTLRVLKDAFDSTRKRHGQFAMMNLVCADRVTQKIGNDVKEESARILGEFGGDLKANAMVVLGTGLGATLLRGFMVALMAFSRSRQPTRCFGNVDDALTWLSSHADLGIGATSGDEVLRCFGIDSDGRSFVTSAAPRP